MDTKYWIAQAIIVVAYILLGIGLRKKNRMEILAFSCIYQALMVIQFTLLGGVMGIIASIIALLRNALFIYNEKKSKANPKWILAVFGVIAIVLTIIFYKSPVDILPCVLTLVGIYSYWASSTKVTRVGNIVISMCYIIYAIPFKSWFSIICEGYLIINTIVGYCKFESKKKSE
jgi:uncharacterized membrane protein HdeD (DUF308 family)